MITDSRLRGFMSTSDLSENDALFFGVSKKALLFIAFVLLAVLVIFLVNYPMMARNVKIEENLFKSRDFKRSPFELVDALDVCRFTAKGELGLELLRTNIDDLSTHLNDKTGIFLVVMKADVGTVKQYKSIGIHCKVSSISHKLVSYREIYGANRASILRSVKFFRKD